MRSKWTILVSTLVLACEPEKPANVPSSNEPISENRFVEGRSAGDSQAQPSESPVRLSDAGVAAVGPSQGVQAMSLGPAEARALIHSLPLINKVMNFDRIDRFLALYLPIVASRPEEVRKSLDQAILKARASMKSIEDSAPTGGRTIALDGGLGELINRYRGSKLGPAGMQNALHTCELSVLAVVTDFYNACGGASHETNPCALTDAERASLDEQAQDKINAEYFRQLEQQVHAWVQEALRNSK